MRRPAAAPAHHPLKKTAEGIPFGVVGNTRGNNNPGKGADWINACTRGIRERDLEVVIDSWGVAHGRSDAFQAGWNELAVSISDSSGAQVILQCIDKFNIPN
jgi:hypothetical protein